MHIFAKYMSYGGVKVGPKMFGGNDQRDLQDMDAEDILTATAQSNIPEDRQDWVVDFELVAKGFLCVIPLNKSPLLLFLDETDNLTSARLCFPSFSPSRPKNS